MKLKSAKAFVQEVAIILIGCFLTAFAVDCMDSGLDALGQPYSQCIDLPQFGTWHDPLSG